MKIPGATEATYTHVFNHMDSIVCEVTGNGVCAGLRSFAWAFISLQALSSPSPEVIGSLRLLPNPNNGEFTLTGSLENEDGAIVLSVSDMLGQVVYRGQGRAISGRVNERIHLPADLANGMYMLTINGSEENHTFHFVLKR